MRKAIRVPFLALALIALATGTVGATPGTPFPGLTPVIVSQGVATERVHFNTGAVKVQTKAPVKIVNQTIGFAAPSTTGWHTHPGVVLVTVTSGTLTRYDAHCAPTVYRTGSAFMESGGHAGLVRNESTTDAASVNVTYLVPEGVQVPRGLRLDADNPGCPASLR